MLSSAFQRASRLFAIRILAERASRAASLTPISNLEPISNTSCRSTSTRISGPTAPHAPRLGIRGRNRPTVSHTPCHPTRRPRTLTDPYNVLSRSSPDRPSSAVGPPATRAVRMRSVSSRLADLSPKRAFFAPAALPMLYPLMVRQGAGLPLRPQRDASGQIHCP